VLVLAAVLAAGGPPASEVRANTASILAAPPGAVFATGEVRVAKDRSTQRLTIGFDWPADAAPGAFSLWIESGPASSVFNPVGPFAEGSTRGGIRSFHLALTVGNLDVLSGRIVQVRDEGGAAVLLEGAVPLDRGARRSGSGGAAPGRADLLRPEAAPRPAARGRLVIDGSGRLSLEAQDLADGRFPDPGLLAAAIETAPGSGVLEPAGALSPVYAGNPWKGSFRLVWRFDVAVDPGAPAGRRIEVHDGSGRPLLWTLLPAVGEGEGARPLRAAAALAPPPGSPSPGARGTVRLRHDPRLGRSGFSLDARGLEGAADLACWLETAAGSGVLEPAGGLLLRGTSVRLVLRSEHGDPLPFGAADARPLAGRAVEVRDGAGRVLLSGVLPLLAGPGAR
jgi:hypothetical protein